MSNLLHSKTFRDNLTKWLILYVLALLIVTGVVTYSRYISKMSGNDNARVARFNIDVEKGIGENENRKYICSTTSKDLCDLDSYKPYDELEYNFTVDVTKLEVKTVLALTFSIENYKDDFELVSVKAQDNEEVLDSTKSKITITDEIDPNVNSKLEYRVKVKLKNYNEHLTEKDYSKIISIKYAATQKN